MKKNTITSNALLLLLCLGLLMISSCRKDLETDLAGKSYSNVSATPSRERIALLRQSFDGLKSRPSLTGNNAVDFYASLTPLWNSARYMPHTNDSVIYMPLLDPSLLADPYTEIFLTIRDRPSEDEYGLIVFNMDSAYYAGSGITPTLENFTGVVYQVTASGLLRHFNTFASGRVVKYCEQISDTQHGTGIHVRDETEDCLDGIFGPDCWDPNKGAFWRGVGGFFKGIWAGIVDIVGSQPGDPSGWMGTWFIGGYNVYFDPSNNTPGGGINTNNPNTPPASTWQYLNEVLDGVLFKKAARMAQKLCDQYGLKLPQESFWDIFAAAGIDFIYANEDWMPQKNFNEIALFENAFRELIYLKAINYPLSAPDNSTTPAYVWLKGHPTEMNVLQIHLQQNLSVPEIFPCHTNAVDYIRNYSDIPLQDFIDAFDEWFNTPDPIEIDNGMEILEIVPVEGASGSYTFLNATEYRHPMNNPLNPPEDMSYGYDSNAVGIKSCASDNCTINDMFNSMTNLFHWCSMEPLQSVGDQYIARFRDKEGTDYYNSVLSAKVSTSSTFSNFIKYYTEVLNTALKATNGNFSTIVIPQVIPNSKRPKFKGNLNKIKGLQILINDTEQTRVGHLNDFVYNTNTRSWELTLFVQIYDHFGLDRHDAVVYQGWHAGFAYWWRLQHKYGYKPFRSDIRFKIKVRGNLNWGP